MHRTATLADGASSAALPPLAEWWPHLTDGARHAILRDLDGPFPSRVLREIERAAGCAVGEADRLRDDDRHDLVGGAGAVAC
ncbi:hypothetical protein ABC304_08940 [Microbacterium sp. 1P10UB]|uniref:hypothetical protein n=1 Tax=unclassified Microbacterium TaxID=2609290 RepID=UPI0039A1075F